MNYRPVSLDEFFASYRKRNEPMVLATVAQTIGSTYRKAGAQMLIAGDGNAAGLLSGGCLEADLVERARAVLDTGQAAIVEYDTRSSDDVLWGIGLGCEGAMHILLTRLNVANDYQPFAYAQQCRRDYVAGNIALTIASANPLYPLGAAYWNGCGTKPPPAIQAMLSESLEPALRTAQVIEADHASFLVVPIDLPTRLLLLGAGPDAMPLVEIAGLMGWHVNVLDHRPAYAIAERFPRAHSVMLNPANALRQIIELAHYDAAVVMSHHLTSDEAYLAALADSAIPYIGLLGPAPRRMRLMNDIGDKARQFGNRLYGPIGLDIGAATPETIALAIVSEIQAVLSGHSGGSYSDRKMSNHKERKDHKGR